MKEDNYFWKYDYEPGKQLNTDSKKIKNVKPLVSIITSYYNSNEFMWQTINCVLNQTFQSWEWIIVDDGSTNAEAIEYLEKVKKIDTRIKIYHKENGGLALGRDYAIKFSTTDYILPLDADDLIEPTYIETLYWTLETNKSASWTFTNSVGFGKYIYLSDVKFDSEKMKTENHITATSLIRKNKILELGGYGLAKRYMNEDWYLWLRMLSDNQFPVQVGYYGFWYRRRQDSLLSDINNEKKKEYIQKMQDIKEVADTIHKKVNAIIYPKDKKNNEKLEENKTFRLENLKDIEILEKNKNAYLYILPYLGTDKKIYKEIKKQSKNKKIYVITMQNNGQSPYFYRQKYETFSTVYDLTTFIDSRYYINFIKYLTETRKIEKIFLSNTRYNKEIKSSFDINEIQDTKNSKFIYNLGIIKYKFMNTLFIRAIRKLGRFFTKNK